MIPPAAHVASIGVNFPSNPIDDYKVNPAVNERETIPKQNVCVCVWGGVCQAVNIHIMKNRRRREHSLDLHQYARTHLECNSKHGCSDLWVLQQHHRYLSNIQLLPRIPPVQLRLPAREKARCNQLRLPSERRARLSVNCLHTRRSCTHPSCKQYLLSPT